MSWQNIYITKNGGTEIDINGWSYFLSLIKPQNLDITIKNTVSDCGNVFGGREKDVSGGETSTNDYCIWIATGNNTYIGGFELIDNNNPRFGVSCEEFLLKDTTEGEHYNCHYLMINTDDFSEPVIRFKFGINCSNGNLRRTSESQKYIYNAVESDDLSLEQLLTVNWDLFPPAGDIINMSRWYAQDSLVFCCNVPMFLTQSDLINYIETGVKRNCFNDENISNIGSDNNKYCQTTIQTMKPNGHDKTTLYDYYYTYKMDSNQDIVGYVKDDENPLNVKFKAKDNNAYITITLIDGNHPFERVLTGSQFNNLDSEGNPSHETWYGCSTKREHTLMGGNICWGVFGRMNIYIFDNENSANTYFETGDPSKALNYDDIDNYDERNANKTGDDANDQKNQMNALVEGWEEPSLSNVYILNATKMKQVAELVFPNVDTAGELPQTMKDLKASLGLYGENPINDIIDVWHCPFNPYTMVGHESRNLWFGSYRSNITGSYVTHHGIIKNMGATVISPIFNDFRDYEIEIVLYLPYFGTVDLPCDIYMGKQVDIKATLDLRSHNLRYYIFTNNTLMEYHDCAVGTSYPLMGQDVAGKASQTIKSYNMVKTAQRNATISAGMSIVNGAIGLMTGNFNQVIQSGANVEQTNAGIALQKKQFEHDVKYTQPPRSIVGSSSPSCSENDIPYPYIVFKIPQTIKPPLLQNTYGLPSNIVTRIGDVSGYAQIENVQLQSSLPLRIQADILNKLASGVVIN